MHFLNQLFLPSTAVLLALSLAAAPGLVMSQESDVLIGTWTGKATGPQGGPPTGDIAVTFEKSEGDGLTGTIVVIAPGGFQYSGKMDQIAVENNELMARAVFVLGENSLQAEIRGPIEKGRIEGGFTVSMQGETLGNGEFVLVKKSSDRL